MISSNALSIYLIQHNQNNICAQNLCSIQDAMCSDEPAGSKFKRVFTDFPNMAVLTKSTTPGDIQVTYFHSYVGNKSLGEMVTDLSLEVYPKAPTMVSIEIKYNLFNDGEKIFLPTTEVLLRATSGNLSKSKNLRDWTSRKAVLLPPFITKTVVADGKTVMEALLKIFSERIK